MPTAKKLPKELTEILEKLEAPSVEDAMILLAVLHPDERQSRSLMCAAAMAAGIGLVAFSTWCLAFGPPGNEILILPMLIGATFMGAALGVAAGLTRSAREISAMVDKLRAGVLPSARGEVPRLPE
ncbi:MAG: hypothetical protein JWN04_6378 [Myxococcaceae bacterium]|nr:hypothetical protein [Myxococcaceae bacterium]